jgi:hypothetical protein
MSDIPKPGNKRKACLVYGCLGLFLFAMIGLVGAYFAVRYVRREVAGVVEKYSQAQSIPLPELTLSVEERKALKTRVTEFGQKLREGTAAGEELILTGDEINVLLAESPGLRPLGDQVRVRLEDTRVLGTISLPLSQFGPSKMAGRYLNGESVLNLSLSNGLPRLFIEDLKVQGQTLPAGVMLALRGVNLAERMVENPEFKKVTERFDSVRVSEGKLILKSKP